MGKKINALREKQKNMVSILTPTYNRRAFIPGLIKCVMSQTYTNLEWVILDDGEEEIADLVVGIHFVRYIRLNCKLTLGEKRNRLNDLARGRILINFDTDDYHMPDRIAKSVAALDNSSCLIAGSSSMFIYYRKHGLFTTRHFNTNHATAGTFAYKRELLKITRFEPTAKCAEERYWLKGYTIPMIQLDPRDTIIIGCHEANTFDKTKLLGTKGLSETSVTLEKLGAVEFFANHPK